MNPQMPLMLNISEEPKKRLSRKESKEAVKQPKEIMSAAPLNSIAQSVKQTPKRNHMGLTNDWRIETQESVESGISPRERQNRKVISYIKKNFKINNECPPTTVDFYRVGKVLGKGAFGKVNIALQVVADQLVAIKSINTSHFKDEKQS